MNLLERNSEIEKDIYAINGAAIEVHKILGHGFHEKVYGDALAVEFKLRGIPFEREKHLLINYKGVALQLWRASYQNQANQTIILCPSCP